MLRVSVYSMRRPLLCVPSVSSRARGGARPRSRSRSAATAVSSRVIALLAPMRLFGKTAAIRQDPWFIGLISSVVIGRTLKGCGLTEEVQAFDRKAYEAGVPIIPPVTSNNVLREDVRIPMADGHLNSARLFTPAVLESDQQSPLVVYIHGGGWCLGTAFTQPYDWMCASLSRDLNWRVLSIDYRLSPEHPFPTPVEDVFSVLTWLADPG